MIMNILPDMNRFVWTSEWRTVCSFYFNTAAHTGRKKNIWKCQKTFFPLDKKKDNMQHCFMQLSIKYPVRVWISRCPHVQRCDWQAAVRALQHTLMEMSSMLRLLTDRHKFGGGSWLHRNIMEGAPDSPAALFTTDTELAHCIIRRLNGPISDWA